MSAANPGSAAYHYDGGSEWCRLSAIDKAANVVRLCRGVPHATVLDVGAGEGSVLGRLAELGFGERYCAIELTESALAAIRGRGIDPLEDCRVFDGEHVPYEDGRFDLAVLSHVVEHAEHPRKLLCEAVRVARHVFVEVPLEHHLRMPRDYAPDGLGHINAYSPASIRRLVQSCGWEVLAQITTHRSRATYTFHGDRLGAAKHAVKDWALRLVPALATQLFTYHGALLFAPPGLREG